MAAVAILDFSEVKSDDTGSHGRHVSISSLHTKFGEDISTCGRVMAIYVFFFKMTTLDFCISKIWRYFCFRDVGFSLWATFLRICAITTELWPFNWISKMVAVVMLEFFESEIWRHRKSWASRIYGHTKFGKDSSTGGRVMAIYVFFQNGGRPPSWIFAEVKFGGISVSGT